MNFSYVEALNSHNPLREGLLIYSFIYLILFFKDMVSYTPPPQP